MTSFSASVHGGSHGRCFAFCLVAHQSPSPAFPCSFWGRRAAKENLPKARGEQRLSGTV